MLQASESQWRYTIFSRMKSRSTILYVTALMYTSRRQLHHAEGFREPVTVYPVLSHEVKMVTARVRPLYDEHVYNAQLLHLGTQHYTASQPSELYHSV